MSCDRTKARVLGTLADTPLFGFIPARGCTRSKTRIMTLYVPGPIFMFSDDFDREDSEIGEDDGWTTFDIDRSGVDRGSQLNVMGNGLRTAVVGDNTISPDSFGMQAAYPTEAPLGRDQWASIKVKKLATGPEYVGSLVGAKDATPIATLILKFDPSRDPLDVNAAKITQYRAGPRDDDNAVDPVNQVIIDVVKITEDSGYTTRLPDPVIVDVEVGDVFKFRSRDFFGDVLLDVLKNDVVIPGCSVVVDSPHSTNEDGVPGMIGYYPAQLKSGALTFFELAIEDFVYWDDFACGIDN